VGDTDRVVRTDEAKRRQHPSYSESAFVRKAGLSANSRGYLRLVICTRGVRDGLLFQEAAKRRR